MISQSYCIAIASRSGPSVPVLARLAQPISA